MGANVHSVLTVIPLSQGVSMLIPDPLPFLYKAEFPRFEVLLVNFIGVQCLDETKRRRDEDTKIRRYEYTTKNLALRGFLILIANYDLESGVLTRFSTTVFSRRLVHLCNKRYQGSLSAERERHRHVILSCPTHHRSVP